MRRAILIALAGVAAARGDSVQEIVNAYINALGGQAAVDRIHSRRAEASSHRIGHDTVFWAAPAKALRRGRNGKEGFDGSNAWVESKKKKIEKLPHSRMEELETDADPIRFVHLREMYHDLEVAKPVTIDNVSMDVISAPNAIAATRFYFNHGTHLLARIEELGVTSAYYKHTIAFEDYQDCDGVRLPTHILRTSDDPGSEKGDLHLTRIQQNVALDDAIFRKPDIGPIVFGGKH